jgi:hypothetical protein
MDGIGASGTGDACGHVGLHCFSHAPGKGRADRYAPATLRAMDRAGAAHGRLVCAPALDSFAPRPFSFVAALGKTNGSRWFYRSGRVEVLAMARATSVSRQTVWQAHKREFCAAPQRLAQSFTSAERSKDPGQASDR